MLSPQDLDLPSKFTSWRSNQYEAVVKAATSSKYITLVDAPTGVGKSLMGAAVQRLRRANVVYLVQTKQLQAQILNDFPYAKTVMGRSNYPCAKYPKAFPGINADHCTKGEKMPCRVVHRCEYEKAKTEALAAPLAVLNYAYFLNEVNFVGRFSGLGFVICDEIDILEDQMMSHVQLVITQKQLERLNLDPPRFKTKFESWKEWARPAVDSVRRELDDLSAQSNSESSWETEDFRVIKRINELKRLLGKLQFFVKEVDKSWVWFPEEDRWTFKPVWVAKYASRYMWDHTDKVLGLSATILDPAQLARNIGLSIMGPGVYNYVVLPSPFPKENRPIFYEPLVRLARKNKYEEYPKLVAGIDKIVAKYPDDKILIHTISYEIRDVLRDGLSCKSRLISHSVQDRAVKLEVFKKSKQPLILISPSMDRGVDLPKDECRVVIIAKCPFPYLGDPQISRRVHGSADGNHWYAHRTVSSIVQMSGRGVRSEDDHADTYIVDEQFERVLNENRSLFPGWYKEAIVM